MIDWELTFKETGFNKDYFDKYQGSGRLVWVICDDCGFGRWSEYKTKCNLCNTCTQIRLAKTPEQKEKNKIAVKNRLENTNWLKNVTESSRKNGKKNIGRKTSDETKAKLSIAHKGKKKSPEHLKNIILAHNTPEYKEKISQLLMGHTMSKEARIKSSCTQQGINIEEWDNFQYNKETWRDWSKVIFLNEPFVGCHRHHITETIVICVPAELHNYIGHNLKTGEGMDVINILALQYINGCYDG